MDKPGQVDIVVGSIWIVMGVLSMAFTIAMIGTISLWSFVPIAIGIAQAGRGLDRSSRAAASNAGDSPAEANRREQDSVLAAMVFVAADKGAVSRERAARIDNVSLEMFGGRPDQERVRAMAERAFDLEIELGRNVRFLGPEARLRVVQATRAVAEADADMDERRTIVNRLMDAL